MPRTLLTFFILSSLSFSQAKILIATVAQVKNEVITSRDVAIHKQTEKVLDTRLQQLSEEGPEEEVINEWLLFFEASTFYNTRVDGQEVNKLVQLAKQRLANSKPWKNLAVTDKELREKISHRLEADRLYQFKKKASVLPPSQTEIETEYSQNRVAYGNQSFNEVKEKIRKNKEEENLQKRMKQWFEVLEKKYKVQRFSSFKGKS